MSYFSEWNRLEQERQVVRAVKINEELLEHLTSTLGWFLNYCEKNHIFPPNLEQLRESVRKAQEFMESLPSNQPTGNSDKNNPKGNRAQKQHPYKVPVRYLTVWKIYD